MVALGGVILVLLRLGVGERFSAERKDFFSEEKKQKTFDRVADLSGSVSHDNKSFLVLFFKKELLAYCPSESPAPRST